MDWQEWGCWAMPDNPIIEISYGPVSLIEPTTPEKVGLVPLLKQIGEGLNLLRGLIVNLVVIGALVALFLLTILELRREPVIIEEIKLPPQLEERGYGSGVASHRLWDSITAIQDNSSTISERFIMHTWDRQIDFVESGSGLSFQGLAQLIREIFGLPQRRIGGEVICEAADCSWSQLRFRVRIIVNKQPHFIDLRVVGGRGTSDYFTRAAVETMRVLDPYSLAVYYYRKTDYSSAT
jgi:hypothetical protein